MTNHPNRGRGNPARNLSPAEILRAREASGLTQSEAAELLFTISRVWQQWESGARRMHPAFWELFNLKRPKRK